MALAFKLNERPQGSLDTELEDVTVVHPPEPALKPERKGKPRKRYRYRYLPHDKRCWPTFGRTPQRSLALMGEHLGRPGFRVETSDGVIDARYVVAATGPFQRPVIPPIVPRESGPQQIHSSGYRNPEQLPDGAVLVARGG